LFDYVGMLVDLSAEDSGFGSGGLFNHGLMNSGIWQARSLVDSYENNSGRRKRICTVLVTLLRLRLEVTCHVSPEYSEEEHLRFADPA
jgi:hypothetical protein